MHLDTRHKIQQLIVEHVSWALQEREYPSFKDGYKNAVKNPDKDADQG